MQDMFNTSTVFQRKDFIVKQKHHLPTKIYIVKVTVFLVVMHGCESLTENVTV